MQKKGGKKPRKRDRAQALQAAPESQPTSAAAASGSGSALDTLKQNLSGKRKAIFEILEDVKKVKPEQWQDPKHVEQMAKNFADRLGLPVPEQRIKQFVSAYKDATKSGPTANVDELVHKYGHHVDDKTLKEIKKFVPKNVK
ncbi:hypothetical protein [Alicyclobacillus kakegawensis]|uniref:hypothetical protein n=1 Tax=Alicyclobacillus kakegawensis TaxID=392012 RepID=UPI000AF694AC|nr:hypothetical protein [Alicyclobacillus kakegawensis]